MNLHAEVRDQERSYTSEKVTLGKYIEWSMYDTIEKIDAYLNSVHTSGETDALGRDKPFFNVVVSTANIWMRATDLDRKDVHMLPDSSDNVVATFLGNVLLQQWMIDARFGVFLNDWGRVLARYGSAVTKFVDRGETLDASVPAWNRMICDPINFHAKPRIEKLFKTASELRNNATKGHPQYIGYDLEAVNGLIDAKSQSVRKTLDDRAQDTSPDYFGLYEVHDMFPDYLLETDPEEPEDESDVTYSQQMHVITYLQMENKEWEDFTLYKGREKKDPYMLTHLIKEDGRTLSIGSVEYMFNTQWMQNHTIKNMKDTTDLVSKAIFQTTDGNFTGRNVLSAMETGDILVTAENKPINALNMGGANIDALINFSQQWQEMSQELTNTPDALRGQSPKSGTAYRLQALIAQQATNLFDLMTENKGLALEDMMREFVLPFIQKKLDNKDTIVAILDAQGVTEIDAQFVPKEAIKRHNDRTKAMLLKGEVPPAFDKDAMEAGVRQDLQPLGNTRMFAPDEIGQQTWREAVNNLTGRVVFDITGESTDAQTVLQTLTTMFQTITANPMVLDNPDARMLFNRILTTTGVISPLQLPPPPPPQPAQGQAPQLNPPTPPVPVVQAPPSASPPSGISK